MKAKQIHKCIKCLKNWESKCAIRKLKHHYMPFIETSGEVFYSKFLCQNFNLELSGNLTEKFNTSVRIVIIISRVKMVNLTFIIFAIMLCNFEFIRTIMKQHNSAFCKSILWCIFRLASCKRMYFLHIIWRLIFLSIK